MDFIHGKNLDFYHEGWIQIGSSHWDTWYWSFYFMKNHLNTSFCWELKFVHKTRRTSFMAWIEVLFTKDQDNFVVHIRIHDSDVWFRKKTTWTLHFVRNQSSSLKWDKLRSWQESKFFCWRAKTNGFFLLGYTIIMFWCHEKTIPTLCSVWNQSSSLKWDKLHLWQESWFFLRWANTNS